MQFLHVFHHIRLQLRMSLTTFNAQMPLNEFNKFQGMLVRNLFGEGKRRNKCRGRKKGFEGKGGDPIPKIKKKKY